MTLTQCFGACLFRVCSFPPPLPLPPSPSLMSIEACFKPRFTGLLNGPKDFYTVFRDHEPIQTSKQLVRTSYLGHVTGYQPIRDRCYFDDVKQSNDQTIKQITVIFSLPDWTVQKLPTKQVQSDPYLVTSSGERVLVSKSGVPLNRGSSTTHSPSPAAVNTKTTELKDKTKIKPVVPAPPSKHHVIPDISDSEDDDLPTIEIDDVFHTSPSSSNPGRNKLPEIEGDDIVEIRDDHYHFFLPSLTHVKVKQQKAKV
eukprot:sb/3468599/